MSFTDKNLIKTQEIGFEVNAEAWKAGFYKGKL